MIGFECRTKVLIGFMVWQGWKMFGRRDDSFGRDELFDVMEDGDWDDGGGFEREIYREIY